MADIVVIREPHPVTTHITTTNPITAEAPGPAGPAGPQGPPGGARYEHTQSPAASQWNITHGLGYYPHVTLIDSGGAKFLGRVEYVDLNNVSIVLNQPVAGKAELS